MRNRPFYTSPIFIGLVMAIITFVAVKPKLDEIIERRDKIEADKIKLERLTKKELFLKNLDTEALKPKVELVVQAIPSEKDFPSFITTMNYLAQEASVSMTALNTSPGKVSTDSGVLNLASKSEALPIHISMEGQLANIKVFLTKMLNSLPVQSLQSFTFDFKWKDKGGEKAANDVFGKVAADFSQAFYYKTLPTELGKVTDQIQKITPDEEELFTKLSGYYQSPKVQNFTPVGREDPFQKP